MDYKNVAGYVNGVEHEPVTIGGIRVSASETQYVRIVQIEFLGVGVMMETHTHPFDHSLIVSRGAVRVSRGAEIKDFSAPATVFIPKHTDHDYTSLTDDAICHCVQPIKWS